MSVNCFLGTSTPHPAPGFMKAEASEMFSLSMPGETISHVPIRISCVPSVIVLMTFIEVLRAWAPCLLIPSPFQKRSCRSFRDSSSPCLVAGSIPLSNAGRQEPRVLSGPLSGADASILKRPKASHGATQPSLDPDLQPPVWPPHVEHTHPNHLPYRYISL